MTFYILGISAFQLTNSIIFQKGGLNQQQVNISIMKIGLYADIERIFAVLYLTSTQIMTHICLCVIRYITGWWFGTFFMLPYIGNNFSPTNSYFSEG